MLLAHLRHTQNLSQNLLGTCYCSGLGVHLVRLVLSSADGIRSRRLDPSRHTRAKPSPFAIKRFPGLYSTPRLPPAPPPAPGHQTRGILRKRAALPLTTYVFHYDAISQFAPFATSFPLQLGQVFSQQFFKNFGDSWRGRRKSNHIRSLGS